MTVLYCSGYREEPGFPGCCGSCHDDEEMGYDGMLELYKDQENPSRLTHLVCCRVHTWLEK